MSTSTRSPNHHDRAGEPAAAAGHFHAAARADLRRGLVVSARRAVEQAIDQWTVAGVPVPWDAHLVVGESLRRLGDFDGADAELVAAAASATAPADRAETLQVASRLAGDRGDPVHDRALLDEAAALDADSRSSRRACRVAQGLAWCELEHGDRDVARRHAETALDLASVTADTDGLIAAHNALGAIAESELDLDGAERHALVCLDLAREIGDLHGEAVARGRLGIVVHLRGDTDGDLDDYRCAVAHYDAAAALCRQLGNTLIVAVATSNLAQAQLRLGDLPASRAARRDAMATLARLGALSPLIFCVLVEADALLAADEPARALALLGLVHAHPSAGRNDHDEIERILSRASLDALTIERGLAAGAGLDLHQVVAELLAEPAPAPGSDGVVR